MNTYLHMEKPLTLSSDLLLFSINVDQIEKLRFNLNQYFYTSLMTLADNI